MDFVDFAKLVTEGHQVGLYRADFEQELERIAVQKRLPGESIYQAFARVAAADDRGRLLFKASLMAPSKPIAAPVVEKRQSTAAAAEAGRRLAADPGALRKLLAEERARSKGF